MDFEREKIYFDVKTHIYQANKKRRSMIMPKVYLSPSLQEYNAYVNGGTEEEIANLIADAMEPYLLASNISVGRNSPEMSLGEAIAQSNAGDYDLHFAIHSNAAPPSLAGQLKGTDAYYFYNSPYGEEAANFVVDNMKQIVPDSNKVEAVPTATLRELRRTNVPSVLVEVGYHDNPEEATWIKQNIDSIAKALAKSITDYFRMPFKMPK